MAQPGRLTLLLVVLMAALTTAETDVSLASSGSGSAAFSIEFPSCDSTRYAPFLNDGNASECTFDTGFSFVNTTNATVDSNWICTHRSCRRVFQNLVSLELSEDCRLDNGLDLVGDFINQLTSNPNCYNSTILSMDNSTSGSGSWNDTIGFGSASYDSDGIILPTTAPVSAKSDSMAAVTIVSITVGALLAFVAVVIAVVWYKRQRMRDLHMQAYGDAFELHKPEQNNRFARGRSVFRRQASDMLDTMNTGSSQEMSFNDGPPMSLHVPGINSGTLWNDEELLARHMRSEDIDDIRVIGNGGHGVVYLVRYRQGRLLASKRLVRDQVTRAKTRALITEIKLVAKLDHPNIVQFVGAAWTTEWDLQALFEYMPNGDLCTYLAKTSHEDGVETWDREKIQIVMDIVEALVYVHSFSPPLVHRDLKSRNVLLTENTRAKLSDFGVSRFQSDACTMTTGVGTSRWLAPEVISGGGEYNQSCDIYSMGMVLSEMDTHRLPFSDLRMPSGNPMPEVSILQLVSQGNLKPSFLPSCPESLREVALRCLAFDPKDRPNAIEVSYTLRKIAKAEFGV